MRRREYTLCATGKLLAVQIAEARTTRSGLLRLKFTPEQKEKLDVLTRKLSDHKRSCEQCRF